MDHSSVDEGDVQRVDHAMAVTEQPMWKFATTLIAVGVCLDEISWSMRLVEHG